jgi:hypothetical protein
LVVEHIRRRIAMCCRDTNPDLKSSRLNCQGFRLRIQHPDDLALSLATIRLVFVIRIGTEASFDPSAINLLVGGSLDRSPSRSVHSAKWLTRQGRRCGLDELPTVRLNRIIDGGAAQGFIHCDAVRNPRTLQASVTRYFHGQLNATVDIALLELEEVGIFAQDGEPADAAHKRLWRGDVAASFGFFDG